MEWSGAQLISSLRFGDDDCEHQMSSRQSCLNFLFFITLHLCRLMNEQWAHLRVGFERWQWVWAGAPPHTWLLSTKPELWVTPKTSSILIPPSCPSHIFEHLHKVQSVHMSLHTREIWNFGMRYLKLEFDIEDEISQVGLRYPICNDQSDNQYRGSTQQLSIVYLFFACSFNAVALFVHFWPMSSTVKINKQNNNSLFFSFDCLFAFDHQEVCSWHREEANKINKRTRLVSSDVSCPRVFQASDIFWADKVAPF